MTEAPEAGVADPEREARLRAAPVTDWLVRTARGVEDVSAFFAEICERIAAEGPPLERSTVHARLLDPQILGLTLQWRRGEAARVVPHSHGVQHQPSYVNSPVYWIYGGAERFRRRLENPEVILDFAVLADLKAEGFTDYIAERLPFTDGSNHAITWATTRAGGFGDEDVAFLGALVPYMGLVLEARASHRAAEILLKTYLGADAGMRVLRGQVQRGSGQTIEAAILFADLRGFTDLSERLPGDRMIALLNDYFESVIAPVEAHGGEVLKLIGDGILAIFPLNRGGPRPMCLAALTAARAAFAEFAEVNRRREARGESPVRFGITLHLGTVIYGNIGGASRLDFTVIGPAVNLVSRLQQLCRRLGKGVLLSAPFAKEAGQPMLSMGRYELRGLPEPQEVFALPAWEDPYYQPDSG
jgi:adenylate cyclase